MYEPVENDPAQLGLNTAQQLQLEEVLTQAIGAPVAGTHAAETGVAAERHTKMRVFTTIQRQHAPNNTHRGGGGQSQDKNLNFVYPLD